MKPLPISFILLPPRPLFHPEISIVAFFHELGHVVYDCFISSPIIKDELKKIDVFEQRKIVEILEWYQEDIAELFSAKILSGLDFNKHKIRTKKALDKFEFGTIRGNFIRREKKDHINSANLLYQRVINNDRRGTNKLVFEFLKFVVKSIVNWQEDKIVRKVRIFLDCGDKDRQNEFWNLWLLLNSIGGKCYITATRKKQ